MSKSLDALPYDDSLTLTRPGSGAVQDPVTGVMTEVPATAVFTTECDCIDQRYEVRRTGDGDRVLVADAQVYVPLSVDLSPVLSDDRVTVIQRDGPSPITRTGTVVDVQVFTSRLLVNWV
jgi:hypothetical protein